jgi:hypothetical protein
VRKFKSNIFLAPKRTWPIPYRDGPCSIDLVFTLTPATCVYRALYDEYRRDTCAQAAATLFEESNKEVFVHYRVHAEGFVPAFGWYVSWPILRKGSASGITRRQAQQGPEPWDYYPGVVSLDSYKSRLLRRKLAYY